MEILSNYQRFGPKRQQKNVKMVNITVDKEVGTLTLIDDVRTSTIKGDEDKKMNASTLVSEEEEQNNKPSVQQLTLIDANKESKKQDFFPEFEKKILDLPSVQDGEQTTMMNSVSDNSQLTEPQKQLLEQIKCLDKLCDQLEDETDSSYDQEPQDDEDDQYDPEDEGDHVDHSISQDVVPDYVVNDPEIKQMLETVNIIQNTYYEMDACYAKYIINNDNSKNEMTNNFLVQTHETKNDDKKVSLTDMLTTLYCTGLKVVKGSIDKMIILNNQEVIPGGNVSLMEFSYAYTSETQTVYYSDPLLFFLIQHVIKINHLNQSLYTAMNGYDFNLIMESDDFQDISFSLKEFLNIIGKILTKKIWNYETVQFNGAVTLDNYTYLNQRLNAVPFYFRNYSQDMDAFFKLDSNGPGSISLSWLPNKIEWTILRIPNLKDEDEINYPVILPVNFEYLNPISGKTQLIYSTDARKYGTVEGKILTYDDKDNLMLTDNATEDLLKQVSRFMKPVELKKMLYNFRMIKGSFHVQKQITGDNKKMMPLITAIGSVFLRIINGRVIESYLVITNVVGLSIKKISDTKPFSPTKNIIINTLSFHLRYGYQAVEESASQIWYPCVGSGSLNGQEVMFLTNSAQYLVPNYEGHGVVCLKLGNSKIVNKFPIVDVLTIPRVKSYFSLLSRTLGCSLESWNEQLFDKTLENLMFFLPSSLYFDLPIHRQILFKTSIAKELIKYKETWILNESNDIHILGEQKNQSGCELHPFSICFECVQCFTSFVEFKNRSNDIVDGDSFDDTYFKAGWKFKIVNTISGSYQCFKCSRYYNLISFAHLCNVIDAKKDQRRVFDWSIFNNHEYVISCIKDPSVFGNVCHFSVDNFEYVKRSLNTCNLEKTCSRNDLLFFYLSLLEYLFTEIPDGKKDNYDKRFLLLDVPFVQKLIEGYSCVQSDNVAFNSSLVDINASEYLEFGVTKSSILQRLVVLFKNISDILALRIKSRTDGGNKEPSFCDRMLGDLIKSMYYLNLVTKITECVMLIPKADQVIEDVNIIIKDNQYILSLKSDILIDFNLKEVTHPLYLEYQKLPDQKIMIDVLTQLHNVMGLLGSSVKTSVYDRLRAKMLAFELVKVLIVVFKDMLPIKMLLSSLIPLII